MDSDALPNPQAALDHLVSRAGQLYSLPAVALEVLELTQESLVDLRALKLCIENDPALTCKVLRVVNSALFGLSGEVTDLNHALTLLGIKPLKLLVLGFSLSDAVFSKLTGRWIGRYWRHTLTKAVAARELSETLWRIPADEPFLIALLQDLGLLVLLQELGEPFAAFMERVWAADGDLLELERCSLGFDHRELTSRMLASWGFPQQLVGGVTADRDAGDFAIGLPAHQALPHVLRMAELLADLLAEGRPGALQALLAMETVFPMSREQVLGIVDRTYLKVDALAEVLSIELPATEDHRRLLSRAHDQLARVAESAAIELLSARRRLQSTGAELEEALLAEAGELTSALRQAVGRAALLTAEDESGPKGTLRRAHAASATLPSPRSRRAAAAEAIDSTLDSDPLLDAGLAAAIAACRNTRAALSLALVEFDGYARMEREHGLLRAENLVEEVAEVVRQFDCPAKMYFRLRKTRYSLVLPGWDRDQASEFHHQLLAGLRGVLVEEPDGRLAPASVSVGLASVSRPSKNFEPQAILESATRCLAAAQRAGGGTMKSIGIY